MCNGFIVAFLHGCLLDRASRFSNGGLGGKAFKFNAGGVGAGEILDSVAGFGAGGILNSVTGIWVGRILDLAAWGWCSLSAQAKCINFPGQASKSNEICPLSAQAKCTIFPQGIDSISIPYLNYLIRTFQFASLPQQCSRCAQKCKVWHC